MDEGAIVPNDALLNEDKIVPSDANHDNPIPIDEFPRDDEIPDDPALLSSSHLSNCHRQKFIDNPASCEDCLPIWYFRRRDLYAAARRLCQSRKGTRSLSPRQKYLWFEAGLQGMQYKI